jgi:hypothetical protein
MEPVVQKLTFTELSQEIKMGRLFGLVFLGLWEIMFLKPVMKLLEHGEPTKTSAIIIENLRCSQERPAVS